MREYLCVILPPAATMDFMAASTTDCGVPSSKETIADFFKSTANDPGRMASATKRWGDNLMVNIVIILCMRSVLVMSE